MSTNYFEDIKRIVVEKLQVDERVAAIIVDKLGVSESQITPEATFAQDLGADSLDTVELVMDLEEHFGVEIPDEAAEKLRTIKDAVDYIASKKAE